MEFGILFSFNYAETSNRILVVRSRQPSLWLLSWAGWVAGEGDLGLLLVAFMGPEQMAQKIPQGKPLVTGCYFGNREHSLGLTTFRQAISRTTVLYSVPLLCVSGNSVKPASWEREQHHPYGEELYHIVDEDETFSVDLANRPPVPVPRPEASAPGPPPPPDNEPYISKVFAEKSQERLGNFYVSSESIRKGKPGCALDFLHTSGTSGKIPVTRAAKRDSNMWHLWREIRAVAQGQCFRAPY